MADFAHREAIRELYQDLGFDLQLRNLLGAVKSTVADVYCPEVRRSPMTDTSVKHIDVVSCWKGLSIKQAAELAYWEEIFKVSLEKMVEDLLIHVFAHHLREENGMHIPIS